MLRHHALQLVYPLVGVKIKYGSDLAHHGPLFFTFSTSVFADSIALGGTKLLKLLVGSGNPWSCTIAGVRLKYLKIDIDLFQQISQMNFIT